MQKKYNIIYKMKIYPKMRRKKNLLKLIQKMIGLILIEKVIIYLKN